MEEKHSIRQLRSFGLMVGGIFLVIGIWPALIRGQNPRVWTLVLGGSLFVPGLIMPSVLSIPYKLWMRLAHVLGWINTKIILSLMFYLVFTPASLIMRLLKMDPMNRSIRSEVDSYRVLREPRSPQHMKHQF